MCRRAKAQSKIFRGTGHKKILFLPSEVPFPMNTYRANLIIGVGGLETNARYKKILCVCAGGSTVCGVFPISDFFRGFFWSRGLSYVGGLKEGVVELATGLCFYTQLNNLGRNLLVFEKNSRLSLAQKRKFSKTARNLWACRMEDPFRSKY